MPGGDGADGKGGFGSGEPGRIAAEGVVVIEEVSSDGVGGPRMGLGSR